MPATRSVARHGSRQPQPYQADGGPANPIPVLPEGALPLLQKLVVERKAKHRSRQNQKQKAHVPLPPDTDIIEISSGDDEPTPPTKAKKPSSSISPHERRIKELEEETKALKAALVAAKAALPPKVPVTEVEIAPVSDLTLTKFLSAVEDEVTCEICSLKMWQPYTLACGHTFCKGCLQDWFSTALMQHLTTHPTYDLQRLVPANMRNALARGSIPTHDRRIQEREVAIRISSIEHPQYSCPTCRVLVRCRPAENYVVKHLVRSIAGAQGELPPKEPTRATMEGHFDGFFLSFACMI